MYFLTTENANAMHIVVDKSFLRGECAKTISEIAKNNKLVMCEALLYECVKESPEDRARLFRKFPDVKNPYIYAPTVGELLRYEIEHRIPCGVPSKHAKVRDYSLSDSLKDGSYFLTKKHQQAVNEKCNDIEVDVKLFFELLISKSKNFKKRISEAEFKKLELRVVNDEDYINSGIIQASKFVSSLVPKNIKYDKSWITFRWFQVLELFSIDLCKRHESIDLLNKSDKAYEKLRHDILDAQYLMLASLEGGFATKEIKLIKWWLMLHGDKHLYCM